MNHMLIDQLLREAKNFVFIGEAGSGKTEIALNLAVAMSTRAKKKIHFFDMDQTKPLLRARDVSDELEGKKIVFHCQSQYLDAPTIASGVLEQLSDPNSNVLMDIGGGAYGSHMIGQFSHRLAKEDTEVLYIINPYRPWSRCREDIEGTMARVLGTARISLTGIVANPNMGPDTKAEDVLEGVEKIRQMFAEASIRFICAQEALCGQVEHRTDIQVFPINLKTLPEWLR